MAALLSQDELFMQRAFDLAIKGLGSVSPNPLVGAVVEYEGKILGEGYHQEFGKAHAEVNAIESVQDKTLLPQSTLYVNLEPCSHFGKTPPCADLILKYKIPNVVISNKDPNPLVAGNGIAKLQTAGVNVKVGLLEEVGNQINKRFFTNIIKKRPYMILKWAQTFDGFIARNDFDSKWISSPFSRKLVHKWRAEEDAVLVGFNTAKYDNPILNVREWEGRSPSRIVFDKNLSLTTGLNLFDQSIKTFVFNELKNEEKPNLNYIKVEDIDNLEHVLNKCIDQQIGSIIVEGGSKTIQTFIDQNIWDEARVFVSREKVFGEGIRAPHINVAPQDSSNFESDVLQYYINLKS